jgi:hypothetical protein
VGAGTLGTPTLQLPALAPHQQQRQQKLTVSRDLLILLSSCSRGSGTVTMPTLGSMVQKGKLAAAALPFSTMALNSVDWCGVVWCGVVCVRAQSSRRARQG